SAGNPQWCANHQSPETFDHRILFSAPLPAFRTTAAFPLDQKFRKLFSGTSHHAGKILPIAKDSCNRGLRCTGLHHSPALWSTACWFSRAAPRVFLLPPREWPQKILLHRHRLLQCHSCCSRGKITTPFNSFY